MTSIIGAANRTRTYGLRVSIIGRLCLAPALHAALERCGARLLGLTNPHELAQDLIICDLEEDDTPDMRQNAEQRLYARLNKLIDMTTIGKSETRIAHYIIHPPKPYVRD